MANTPNFNMLIPDMDTVIDTDIAGLAASLGIIDTELKHLEDNKLETSAAYVHPNHTGDVTSSGDGAQTITANAVTEMKIADQAVTLAKMKNMATASLIGRNSAGAGIPEVLSKTDVQNLINVEDGAEVNNISDINATDLTDGGETTLHEHINNLALDLENTKTYKYSLQMSADGFPQIKFEEVI